MKILMTLSYYLPNISGLTLYVKNLGEELLARGHFVSILTTQHDKTLPIIETINGVTVRRVPYLFKVSKGFFMPSYFWHAITLSIKTNIVIINLPQFEGFFIAVLSKVLRKRLYCVYHCKINFPKKPVNYLVENILHGANFISLLLCNKIITSTQDFANHSKILLYFSQKLEYIYPPIRELKTNSQVISKLKAKMPLKKRYYIGFAGRFAEDKGLEYLLNVVPFLKEKLHDDFLIIFSGPERPIGEEEYWQKLTPLFNKYRRHLFFLGTLSFEEMGSFYSMLDVLILPSINSTEAFGMVQVEAMFNGVPVVATDLPGVRAPIKITGMGEIAKIKNSEDLAKKVSEVLMNKERYIKDEKKIKKTFSLSETINQWQKILKIS